MIRSTNLPLFPVTALVAFCAVSVVNGQEKQAIPEFGSPQSYQKGAFDAMKQGNWKLALGYIDKCISLYGERYKDLGFGDKFGWFYYQKGVCYMQLKDYANAIAPFEECYNKFTSDDNEFSKMALYGMGEARFLSKDYDQAKNDLEKFLKERRSNGRESRINVGQLYSMMAQCYFLGAKPDFAKGAEALSLCINNRYKGQGIADSYIVDGTLELIKLGLKENKLAQVIDFLKKQPSALDIGAARLAPFYGPIINLTSDFWKAADAAQKKGDSKLANQCYQMIVFLSSVVPNKADVQMALKPVMDLLGQVKKAEISYDGVNYPKAIYTAALKSYEKMDLPIEAYAVKNVGSLFGNMGSTRASNAAFQIMEDRYPMDAKGREGNLFRLILTSWQLGDFDRGTKYIDLFVKDYPQSEFMGTINSLSIENLLKQGKFEECLAEARKLKELYADDPENEFSILAAYCEAGSLYRLKRFAEAAPLYEQFIKTYVESPRVKGALYELGSSYVSMREYGSAIKTFSQYIKEFPEIDEAKNPLLPFVYYERAFSYAQRHSDNRQEDDNLSADDCRYIIEHFKNTAVYPNALIMLGNIYSTAEEEGNTKLHEANDLYKEAYKVGKEKKNLAIASEALYSLISNYEIENTPESLAEAQKYYDMFWKDCDDPKVKNDFALQIGVLGMKLHKDGGAGFDAAAAKLRDVIVREGRRDALNPAVEKAIGSYSMSYFETMEKMGKPVTQDQAKDHFYNFSGVKNSDVGLRTLLRTALIGVYQDMIAAAKPDQTALKAELEGSINVFFQELEHDFKPADLSTYTLLKLGSHLAKSSQPLRGVPYFDEILKRNKEFLGEARFNKAIALGLSKDKAKIDEGIKMMVKELANPENVDQAFKEEAQYYLAQFYYDKQDYTMALEQAAKYLEQRAYSKNKVKVLFIQAEAYESMGDIDNALIAYMNLANGYTPRVSVSAPATVKVMELYWKRNKPKPSATQEDLLKSSDRLLAWKEGSGYVRKMSPNLPKMTIPDRTKFREVEELTKKYGSDPKIMAEDKAIEDRKAAINAAKGRKK